MIDQIPENTTDSSPEIGLGNLGTEDKNMDIENGNTEDVVKSPEPGVRNSEIPLPDCLWI